MSRDPHHLIDAHLDGSLSPDDATELTQWLHADASHMDQLLERAELHLALRRSLTRRASSQSPDAPLPFASHREVAKPRRSFGPALAVAAALLLVAAIVGVFAYAMIDWSPSNDDEPKGPAVAIVVEADGAVFRTKPFVSGDSVPADALEIERGSLTLDFLSGATVTLRGPARFVPSGTHGGTLESGRLFARAPEDGSGMRIDGPDFAVTDLGTAFAIRVNGVGDSDVFVTEGTVELKTEAGESRSVRAGHGYHIGADATLAELSDDQIIEAFGPVVLAQNEAERELLESEPAAYLPLMRSVAGGWRDMMSDEPFNAAGVRFDEATGAAVFDGSGAIELGDRDDLMIDAPMTFEARVWIEPGGGQQRLFSVDRGDALRRVGWGVAVEPVAGGYRPFFTHYRVLDYRFQGAVIPAGRWVHLAFAVDADTITLYLDGESLGTLGRTGDLIAGPAHAFIGRLADNTQHFHGRVAWLAVHRYTMSPGEIKRHSEIGEQP